MELRITKLLHPFATIITLIVIVLRFGSCNYYYEVLFPVKEFTNSRSTTSTLFYSNAALRAHGAKLKKVTIEARPSSHAVMYWNKSVLWGEGSTLVILLPT